MATVRVTQYLKTLQSITLLQLPPDLILHLISKKVLFQPVELSTLGVKLIVVLESPTWTGQNQLILREHLRLHKISEVVH